MDATCHCGKPAPVITDQGTFCVDCYAKLVDSWDKINKGNNERLRLIFANQNFLLDEMAYSVGMRPMGPRIQIPAENAPITMNTTNNIRLEAGSQVGQINAASVVYLDRAVSVFNGAGRQDLAKELRTFTEEVLASKDLSQDAQKQVLDLLRCMVEELMKQGKDRNGSVLRMVFSGIGPLLSVGSAIASHWEKLKQLFESLVQ